MKPLTPFEREEAEVMKQYEFDKANINANFDTLARSIISDISISPMKMRQTQNFSSEISIPMPNKHEDDEIIYEISGELSIDGEWECDGDGYERPRDYFMYGGTSDIHSLSIRKYGLYDGDLNAVDEAIVDDLRDRLQDKLREYMRQCDGYKIF